MPKKKTKNKTKNKAIWIVCNMCEEWIKKYPTEAEFIRSEESGNWWCKQHKLHVFECECLPLEEFTETHGFCPYTGETVHKEE